MTSHRFIDPLDKHSQEEDGGDRGSQIAGDGLDVIKQLTALGRLHHGDPADADSYNAQNPDSKEERDMRTNQYQFTVSSTPALSISFLEKKELFVVSAVI